MKPIDIAEASLGVMLNVYESIVRPHLEYCAQLNFGLRGETHLP